jgi:microcystin-dependent protein
MTLTLGGDGQISNLTGQVCFFAMQTAPLGFLACNGQAVSRTTYSALFSAIGTLYGAGDGSTTFNLPDLRAEFIRGWDNGRGVDSGRVFGSTQDDAFQGHWHGINVGATAVGNNGGGGVGTGNLRADALGTLAQARATETNGTNGTPRIASETRPRNVALLACIKF